MFGVFCLFFFVFSRVYGQPLLTQAFLSGAGGINVITNSLNLSIVGGVSRSSYQTLLFRNVWVQTGDVGQVYTLRPTDNPADFGLITHYLTDGIVDYLGYNARVYPGGTGRSGIPESTFFSSLPPGNNGVDLKGFDIAYYSLVFTSLKFESPGWDPNKNGLWTDYSYSAIFSVYGVPVPEPASLTLSCFILSVLFAKTKWANKSSAPTATFNFPALPQ